VAEALAQLRVSDQEGELVYASDAATSSKEHDKQLVSIPRRVLYLQGFLLGAVALVFFVFGLIVGSRSSSQTSTTGVGPCTLTGRVLYENSSDATIPDAGSVVVALPVATRPDEKAEVSGLRPVDPAADESHPGLAVIRSVGGDYARADRRGRYRLRIAAPGRYYLLFISRNRRRAEDEQPKAQDLSQIGRYFLPATQILGNHRYRWTEMVIQEDRQLNVTF
jgi:hypothetical protein